MKLTIEDLWRVDDLIKARFGKKFYRHIDPCGLSLIRPLMKEGYSCTPENSLSFATTEGDGVHFGFINLEGKSDILDGPVVMTVPMTDKNNIVVSENLEEFLSFGYHVGWFGLEFLAYDEADTLQYYAQPDPELSKEQLLFLQILREELSFTFKPLNQHRLEELHEKYFHQLIIQDDQKMDLSFLDPKLLKKLNEFYKNNIPNEEN